MTIKASKIPIVPITKRSGFALVLTLIIVVLAAVTVVAFLTTTITERTTAVAYARIDKADLFAEAAVDAAIARLTTEMQYRPYHAIGYRSVPLSFNGTLLTETIPVITGPRTKTPSTDPTYNRDPDPTQDVYLISFVGGDPPGSTVPALTTANSVDLNDNHLSTEPHGWIGSPTTSSGILPYRVPWVEVLRDPTRAEQHNDPNAPDYNPVIGRYAYWIEDETSKLDVSLIGNQDNGGAFQRGDGVDLPNNTPPKLAVNDLDLGAVPLVGASPLPAGDTQTNPAIITFRATMPMLDARFLNRVGGQIATNVHETVKFYATLFSLSNDLAGNGRRRANINALVTSPANRTTAVPAGTIAGNIDDIIYVISGRHLLSAGLGPAPAPDNRVFKGAPDNYTNTLVNFGLRFFTGATPTVAQQTIYLEKLAANIRDYIDADSQSTIIDSSNKVPNPSAPIHSLPGGGAAGPNEVIAIGKENAPFLQEYLLRVKEVIFSARTGTSANYKIEIDHYLEFWNMTTKDITVADLGPNPFLRIANQFGWNATGATAGTDIPESPSRDFSVPLSAFRDLHGNPLVFRAGIPTVLATDPTALPSAFATNSARLFRPSTGTVPDQYRVYQGITTLKSGSNLRITAITRPTADGFDTETELILGNDNGIIESFGAPAVDVMSVNVDDGTGTGPGSGQDSAKLWTTTNNNTCAYHFRGSSLKGNAAAWNPIPSQKGDPRTNNEQLSLSSSSSVGDDQTAYKNELNSTNLPNYVTLTAPNSQFVDCPTWPDPSSNTADQNNAPAVVANAALTSIGQLGNVLDPARAIGTGSGDISYSRGGGRTAKIGQPDDLITGARFSASWFNAAWRLTDLFAARPVADPAQPAQQSEMVAPPTSRGKININGVLRDGGVAFRAALRSFNFLASPNSDPQLNGQAFPTADVNNLIASITTYLTTNGPLMERGEISQLAFFNPSGNLAGHSIATTNDRGREEIFRRTVEMITTRSASFTVYAIGEAVRQDRSGTQTTVGQKRLAITFQLEPQVNGAPLQNSTVPHDVVDSYRVKRIYAPN